VPKKINTIGVKIRRGYKFGPIPKELEIKIALKNNTRSRLFILNNHYKL
tara:strand:+ start:140 stop:286 length:147 start_codon:yes stop_codon:yes gene_type:complete